jgi:hypothetical protein
MCLIIVSSFGQTKLDTLLFNKINEYRISKHLNELVWDTSAYKASKHHNDYLVKNSFNSPKRYIDAAKAEPLSKTSFVLKPTLVYPHREDCSIFFSPSDRYKYYGGKEYVGEVIIGTHTNNTDSIVSKIIDGWKNSPEHNKIILDKDAKFGSGSIFIEILNQGIKGRNLYFATSTFMII